MGVGGFFCLVGLGDGEVFGFVVWVFFSLGFVFLSSNDLTTVCVSLSCLGRWFIREGWLLVVPSKGGELKRRMFFLFSDICIATKPCHPLHLLNSNKLACQAVYPLHQCRVKKVFGHTQGQGGLLSISLPVSV